MSEYPQAPQASWPLLGEASVPPLVPLPYASARNTPLSWQSYCQNYTPFPVAVANNINRACGTQQHPVSLL